MTLSWPRVTAMCPSTAWSKPHEALHDPGGEPMVRREYEGMVLTVHVCRRCGLLFAICDRQSEAPR